MLIWRLKWIVSEFILDKRCIKMWKIFICKQGINLKPLSMILISERRKNKGTSIKPNIKTRSPTFLTSKRPLVSIVICWNVASFDGNLTVDVARCDQIGSLSDELRNYDRSADVHHDYADQSDDGMYHCGQWREVSHQSGNDENCGRRYCSYCAWGSA